MREFQKIEAEIREKLVKNLDEALTGYLTWPTIEGQQEDLHDTCTQFAPYKLMEEMLAKYTEIMENGHGKEQMLEEFNGPLLYIQGLLRTGILPPEIAGISNRLRAHFQLCCLPLCLV